MNWDIETTAENIARKHSKIKGGRLHGDWYNLSKLVATEALSCAQNQHEEDVKNLKEALFWYAEKAESLSRYMQGEFINFTPIEAILIELSLDAGNKANFAKDLNEKETPN